MRRLNDKLIKVQSLLESLDTKLQSTKITDLHTEITSRIGSLSAPSKMPCHSWSISSKHCITGSQLAKVPGTPCFACYASKGRYAFRNVQNALETRLQGWLNDKDWSKLMAIRLILLDEGYFRWFDSGDLQSEKMLQDINDVAVSTNQIKHWLPTQEAGIVKRVGAVAPNLVIRVSSTKIGVVQHRGVNTSSIEATGTDCNAKAQGGKCLDCRACWDRTIQNINYYEH